MDPIYPANQVPPHPALLRHFGLTDEGLGLLSKRILFESYSFSSRKRKRICTFFVSRIRTLVQGFVRLSLIVRWIEKEFILT